VFTNIFVTKRFEATNAVIDGLTATNLHAPGSGSLSFQIGNDTHATNTLTMAVGDFAIVGGYEDIGIGTDVQSFSNDPAEGFNTSIGQSIRILGSQNTVAGHAATATGTNLVAVGHGAVVSGQNSVALGDATSVAYDYAAGIGSSAAPTANHQIRLGTASEHVSIPGEVRDVVVTNLFATGTNRFDGGIYITQTNATGMANGDVLLDLSPNVSDVELSGNSATINICGIKNGARGRDLWIVKTNVYNLVIKNLSGAAGTAASERIFTGTGGDVTFTNREALIHLRYRQTLSAWLLDKAN
jgi:hypothetical protein